ncbi:hypothetical protein NX722_14290 [Endozoicomonas gorgoniicola]|uniref:Uncharacterized protein n=1 Tax=Endozoicomonas gorgoniicola TaxID=1234144 RepID=A0ABT3MWM1_9GAMM|nr:hypothetical protein [Endozoicomonas gorgoniicola]MCW7553778.1 hypothetical protein [Endozoicomonas gorgoniicola]
MKAPKKPLSKKLKKIRRDRKIEQRKKYKFIFINGKQVKVKRDPEIDGMPVDDFIRENADLIWLHQNGLWHFIETEDEIKVDCEKYDKDNPEIPF